MQQFEFNLKHKRDLEKFDETLKYAYSNYDEVCFVFHTSQIKYANYELLCKMLPILEKYREQCREKLRYTIIYVDATWKVVILKAFLKILKPEKDVIFKLIK